MKKTPLEILSVSLIYSWMSEVLFLSWARRLDCDSTHQHVFKRKEIFKNFKEENVKNTQESNVSSISVCSTSQSISREKEMSSLCWWTQDWKTGLHAEWLTSGRFKPIISHNPYLSFEPNHDEQSNRFPFFKCRLAIYFLLQMCLLLWLKTENRIYEQKLRAVGGKLAAPVKRCNIKPSKPQAPLQPSEALFLIPTQCPVFLVQASPETKI